MPAVRIASSTRVSHRGHPARVLRLVLLGLLTFRERAFLVLVALVLLTFGEIALFSVLLGFLLLPFRVRTRSTLVGLRLLTLGEVAAVVLLLRHVALLGRVRRNGGRSSGSVTPPSRTCASRPSSRARTPCRARRRPCWAAIPCPCPSWLGGPRPPSRTRRPVRRRTPHRARWSPQRSGG